MKLLQKTMEIKSRVLLPWPWQCSAPQLMKTTRLHLKYYEIEGNSKILIRILKKQIPAPQAIRIINHTHGIWYLLQNYTHVSF